MEHKPSIIIKIISWLLLIFGILSLLSFLPVLLIGSIARSGFVLFLSVLNLLLGAGYIATAFGLRKMKMWAVTFLTVITVLGILLFIYNYLTTKQVENIELVTWAIQVAVVGYLWTIKHKFK